MLTEESKKQIDAYVAKFPTLDEARARKAALLPALYVAQAQNDGWLPRAAMADVGEYLGLPAAYVEGVATFYTMYNKAPVGKHHLEVCHNIVCMVRGADALIEHMGEKLKIDKGGTTDDGNFTLSGAECLGACANAPCMMVGPNYYEDLTPEKVDTIIDKLAAAS